MFNGLVTVIYSGTALYDSFTLHFIMLGFVSVSTFLHGPDFDKIIYVLINTHTLKKSSNPTTRSDLNVV